MRMIYCEMRKSWLKASVLLVLILFSALNLVQVKGVCEKDYSLAYKFDTRGMAYHSLYETVRGKLDEEKVKAFRERAAELKGEVSDQVFSMQYQPDLYYTGYVFGDFNLYNLDIGSEISYCATYPNISNAIAENAKDAYIFYQDVGNLADMKKSAVIYNSYQGRVIPEYRTTKWAEFFFSNQFSSLLCVVLLILVLSAGFTNERESGMWNLIGAAAKRNQTILSKFLSTAVFCVILTMYFTAFDLILANVFLGIEGIHLPFYSASEFQNSPFSFTFFTAIWIWCIQRFLALLVIALLFLLISKLSANTMISSVCCFSVSAVMIALTAVNSSPLNPFYSLMPAVYTKDCEIVMLFNMPILKLYAAGGLLIAEAVALYSMLQYGERKNVSGRV